MIEQKKELTGYPSVDKPWLKYYSEEAINTSLPECSIYEYMWDNNKDYPSDIAINYMGRKITYKELFENIDKTASAFIKAGVKEKEIVTVALPSIPEALYCVYALNKIGAVANMIHPLAGKEETLNYLNEVKSRVAVIFDGAYDTIANDIDKTSVEKVVVASPADSLPFAIKIAYGLKVKKPQLDGKQFVDWKDFVRAGREITIRTAKKDCHEMAIISHTGGTTGEPKGVMCSDNNINALIWQIGCNLPHVRQEKYLVVLPPFINYSLINSMLEPLAFGFQVILIPKYEPQKFAEYIEKYRPNHISSIPPYWETLLNDRKMLSVDLSCLNHIYYGGEGMSIETENAINELLISRGAKNKLCKGLGSTEMMSAATVTYDESNMPGSVGVPLVRVNCKIIGDDGKLLHYKEEGEICFSGPTLMLGYYENKVATDEIVEIDSDGVPWLHTGDIGRITEDGLLFVTGRIKRIIMTKGRDGQVTKMFPDRIEKVIYKHQAVELCCVIGVANKERINYPKAFIVTKEKATIDSIKSEIVDLCKQNLPEYMLPVEIEFRTDLPRTQRGKVDYRALEQETDNMA